MIFACMTSWIMSMQGRPKLSNGNLEGSGRQAVTESPPLFSTTAEIGKPEETQLRQWYAIYAKPYREDTVQFHLQKKGLHTFFPKLRLPSSRLHRRQIVPLFPNYLFAHLRIPEDYNLVRWSPGVKHVVSCNGIPTPLEDTIMDFLRHKAMPDDILTAQSNLAVGSGVRIIHGP